MLYLSLTCSKIFFYILDLFMTFSSVQKSSAQRMAVKLMQLNLCRRRTLQCAVNSNQLNKVNVSLTHLECV